MNEQPEKTGLAQGTVSEPRVADELPIDLEAALEHLGGNREILWKVLRRFLECGPSLLNEVKQYALASDTTRLRISAHGLKGAAANICAEPTRRAAETIEEMACENHLENIKAAMTELDRQFTTLRRHLEGQTNCAVP